MGLGLILGYVGILLLAGLTPPGVGFLGELIVGIGSELLSWLHVPAFALLCWLITGAFYRRSWPRLYAWGAGMGCTILFGLWLEVLQGSVEGRVTAGEDLVIDALGATLAVAVDAYRISGLRRRTSSQLEVPLA